MSNPSRTYRLVEKELGQSLRTWVRNRYVDRGESWSTVAMELHKATGLGVTAETLRVWFQDMKRPRGKPEPESAEAS